MKTQSGDSWAKVTTPIVKSSIGILPMICVEMPVRRWEMQNVLSLIPAEDIGKMPMILPAAFRHALKSGTAMLFAHQIAVVYGFFLV